MSSSVLRVNDFADKSEATRVYFKKVGEKKSDGFAVVCQGEVYVIDAGRGKDGEMLRILLEIREEWRKRAALADTAEAKLDVHVIISHLHPDHVAAFPIIFADGRIRVRSVLLPERSHLADEAEGALPDLIRFENRIDALMDQLRENGHPVKKPRRIPFGEKVHLPIPNGNAYLDLYPAHLDWSETRESESEGMLFLKKYASPTYADNPELGYANGIMNGNSLWVKLTSGNQVVLITGDQRDSDEMLGAMIRHYGREEFLCDVMKLPHHGEKNYPRELLEYTRPNVMIFTAADGDETPETKALCARIGRSFFLCDGTLKITLEEGGIRTEGILPR